MSYDLRTCQFCREQIFVYRDGGYELFKYGPRHYAHAMCLAKKRGEKGGEALIPEHQRKDYRFHIGLYKPSGWERLLAKMADKKRGTP